MNKNLLRIYALIMIECRLSLEDASRLFNIDAGRLNEELSVRNLNLDLFDAIEYLKFEASGYPLDNKRGLFKANIYVRRLKRILGNQDKTQPKAELDDLVRDLKGPDISFAFEKSHSCKYSKEEREKILKYCLKYCKTGYAIEKYFHVNHERIKAWENELPEGELKTRLQMLREFFDYKYTDARRK